MEEVQRIGLPEFNFSCVEIASVSPMPTSGFMHSNGIRITFGRYFIIHSKSPLNLYAINRLHVLANEVVELRALVKSNEEAINHRDWKILLKNKDRMSQFIDKIAKDPLSRCR